MGEDHAAAAVALETDGIEGVTIGHLLLGNEANVAFPKVAGDLAAGEAADGDDHFGGSVERLYCASIVPRFAMGSDAVQEG